MTVVYIFLGILVALLLYAVRSRFRFMYGVLEILFGVVAMVVTLVPHTNYVMLHASPPLPPFISHLAGMAAGVYIIIRGLDNMAQELPRSWRPTWRRIFGVGA